jgi:hypothetical protein
MVLRASRYGLFYGCERFPLCNAAHGAHRDTGKPLGVPADAETKRARIRAHDAFDTLWKTGRMTRPEAYRWMQSTLGLRKDEAHVGMFDTTTCERLIDAVASAFPSKAPFKNRARIDSQRFTRCPDGWGTPEYHEQGGEPPFDVDDELTREFQEIVQ